MKFVKTLFFAASCITQLYALDPIKEFTWEVIHEKGDTKVYKSKNKLPGSDIIPIRAHSIFNAPVKKVLTLLQDTKGRLNWVPRLKEARTIKKLSPYHHIEYSRYTAPWPFYDRSFVIRNKGHFDDEGSYYARMESTEIKGLKEGKRLVRGKSHFGIVIIKPLDGGKKSYLEMAFLTDFKGNIPDWVINIIQHRWPLDSFARIRKELKKDFPTEPRWDFDNYLKNVVNK